MMDQEWTVTFTAKGLTMGIAGVVILAFVQGFVKAWRRTWRGRGFTAKRTVLLILAAIEARFLGKIHPWGCVGCDEARFVRRCERVVPDCVRCRREVTAQLIQANGKVIEIKLKIRKGERITRFVELPVIPSMRVLWKSAAVGPSEAVFPDVGRRRFRFWTWTDGGMTVARYREEEGSLGGCDSEFIRVMDERPPRGNEWKDEPRPRQAVRKGPPPPSSWEKPPPPPAPPRRDESMEFVPLKGTTWNQDEAFLALQKETRARMARGERVEIGRVT